MAAVTEEVDELIKLLDRYLELRGDTLTTYEIDEQSTSPQYGVSPPLGHNILTNHNINLSRAQGQTGKFRPLSALPPSLQYFSPVSLKEHLEEQSREQKEYKWTQARIVNVCLDLRVVNRARDWMAAEYVKFQPGADIELYAAKGVAGMLARLRAEQKRARVPVEKTFTSTIVTGIARDGRVMSMESVHLPILTSWKEMQEALTRNSGSGQAEENGCPYGYGLKDGKWMYQTTISLVPQKTVFELVNAKQYHEMRAKMNREGIGVLIWHELTHNASEERRVIAAMEENTRCKKPEDEPLNADGTPYFAATFSTEDLVEGMREDEQLQLRSPSFSPISDDENDGIRKRKRLARF